MSFIDDLERSQELRQAEAVARAVSLARAREEAERLAKIVEAEALRKRTPNNDDREFARLVREESGVGELAGRLRRVLASEEEAGIITGGFWVAISHAAKPENVNSAVDSVTWAVEDKGRGPSFGSACYESTKYRYKYLDVESDPDGNILFHGSTRNLVLYQQWMADRGELDRGLEQAFKNPSTKTIERGLKLVCTYSPSSSRGGSWRAVGRGQVWPGM